MSYYRMSQVSFEGVLDFHTVVVVSVKVDFQKEQNQGDWHGGPQNKKMIADQP